MRLRSRALLESSRETLVVPASVVLEIDQLLVSRGHATLMLRFLEDLAADAFLVENLGQGDYERIRELCDRYADSDIGFVDAAVLAIVERLNEPKLVTLDQRHFGM